MKNFNNATFILNEIVKNNWSDALLIDFAIEGDEGMYSVPVIENGLIKAKHNSASIYLDPKTDGLKKVLIRKIIDNKLCWL